MSSAERMILARETVALSVGHDERVVFQALAARLVDEAKRHPCVENAAKEGRTISMYIKIKQSEVNVLMLEMWSDDCE